MGRKTFDFFESENQGHPRPTIQQAVKMRIRPSGHSY